MPEPLPALGLQKASVRGMNVRLGRGMSRLATAAVLILGDAAAYLFAYLAVIHFFPQTLERADLQRALTLAGVSAIVCYASWGLYPGYRMHNHESLRRRTLATVKVAVLASFGAMILPQGSQFLVPGLGFLGVGLMLQPPVCWGARRLCRSLGVWGERAAIIGRPQDVAGLATYFAHHWTYGIRPEPAQEAQAAIAVDPPTLALVADDKGSFLAELPTICKSYGEVILLSDTPAAKVSGLQPADMRGEIGVRLAGGRSPGLPASIRRAMDLVIAVPAFVMVLPFLLAAAGLIYLIDPGPVLFVQKREGVAGKPVRILKLRTMYQDAEQRLEALFKDDPAKKSEWLTHFKLKQDPRILPVIGQALRSTSFDELPQLVNVIAGQMAIVGPRPFPEYHLLAMDLAFRDKRRSVLPGLTGLWQISARSSADLKLQQQLDEFYIDNRSFWFDWHILLSTIQAVFKRDGAY